MSRIHLLTASMLVIALIATCGCGGSNDEAANSGNGGSSDSAAAKNLGKIAIDGSSTVYPVTEAVVEEFQNQAGGKVHVTVGISGTGGGFKKFARSETDISNASRPILTEEMEQARSNGIEYMELPVCFDALTVVVSTQNDWVDSITVEELKQMWEPGAQDKVTHWNQIRSDWPDAKINLYGAGSDSGTFDYFTEAIVGKAKSSRGDYTASEDDNVLVQGISGDKFALGYLPFAYYEPNKAKLKALAIDPGTGEAVMPTLENVLNGTYSPLSRPLFIYVSAKSAERREVSDFVEFYLKNVVELSQEVHYLPLPEKAYEMAGERFKKRQTGTGFGGVPEVGLQVEEILQREPKQ